MSSPETAVPGAGPLQTAWSVVLGARDLQGPERDRMMNRLIEDYWRPVYRFVRLQWNAQGEEAKDLTQDYFVHFMEHDLLGSVSPDKGRFRTFVRMTLQRFLIKHHRDQTTQKRGGNRTTLPIDWVGAEADEAPSHNPVLSADERFDRLWATDLLDRAVHDLQKELGGEGRPEMFEIFKACCLDSPALSYREAAARHALTETAIRNGIFTVRKRLRNLVRSRIRESVSDDALIDPELGYMMRLLEAAPDPA